MNNTLRIQFGGICCLAVRVDDGRPADALALLADARRPGAGHHHGNPHPPHAAVIQFFLDQLSPDNEIEPHLVFRRAGSRREEAVYFLARHHVEVTGVRDDQALRLLEGLAAGDVPADAYEEADFRWVADSERLGVQGLVSGCLDAGASSAAPDALLARFALRGGTLSTGSVESAGDYPVTNTFRDYSVNPPAVLPEFREALALWSDWEVPIRGEEVALELSSLEDGGRQGALVFSTRGLPFGSSLAMAVKNVPLADLFEIAEVIEPSRPPAAGGGHFALHYALADPPPARPWQPDSTEATDGKPSCPPLKIFV